MMLMCSDEPAASDEPAQIELAMPPAEDEAMVGAAASESAHTPAPAAEAAAPLDAASESAPTPAPTPEAAPLDAGASYLRFFAANHSWVALCASDPAVPRYARAQLLAISLLGLMAGVGLLYVFLFPDLGCQQFYFEADCLEMLAPYDPDETACEWTKSKCDERTPDADYAFEGHMIFFTIPVLLVFRPFFVGVEWLYLRVFNAPRPPFPLWQKLLAGGVLALPLAIMLLFVLTALQRPDHVEAWFLSALICIAFSTWVYEPAELGLRYCCYRARDSPDRQS